MVKGCKNLKTYTKRTLLFIRQGYNTGRWWHEVLSVCLKVIYLLSTMNPIKIPQPQPFKPTGMQGVLPKHMAATVQLHATILNLKYWYRKIMCNVFP
jgi:hypothetical protein